MHDLFLFLFLFFFCCSKREEAKGNHSCGAGVVSEEANPEFGRLRRGLLRILSTSQYYQPEDKLSLLPRQKVRFCDHEISVNIFFFLEIHFWIFFSFTFPPSCWKKEQFC